MAKTLSEMTQLWDKTLNKLEKRISEPKVFELFFKKSYINDINKIIINFKTKKQKNFNQIYTKISQTTNVRFLR